MSCGWTCSPVFHADDIRNNCNLFTYFDFTGNNYNYPPASMKLISLAYRLTSQLLLGVAPTAAAAAGIIKLERTKHKGGETRVKIMF